MERQSDEQISLFVRDKQTGRFVFNAKALQASAGINPLEAQQCGYQMEGTALADATGLTSSWRSSSSKTPSPPSDRACP